MVNKTGGLVGIWSDEHSVLKAAEAAKNAGFTKFDAITPFPVHGMDDAMGLKRSWLPWVTFVMGAFGCAFAIWLQWYVAAYDWPLNIGGKPFFSLPAFIPVAFELTVLIGGLSTVAALFYMCGLPKVNPPIIDTRLTDDKFAIFIPENDTGYNVEKIDKLFRQLG
ncbi:MAG TPA: DUF3341 domain-containing protein, partial [Bdellovibrionales bacterium]|nr:DUF3341 domain-containing protein [Bdellovibrionales bacterium]